MRAARELSAAQSPALAPPPGNLRFPMMDAVRGATCVTILIIHNGAEPNGVVGNVLNQLQVCVQVFFAISGFLLFRPYLLALARGKRRPGTLEFLRRRALRILPGYWFALTATALIMGPTIVNGPFGHHWWRFYGFLQVYSEREHFMGIGPAWTLCVEVSFYLLLPILAFLMWRLARRGDWLRAALIVTALFSVLGPICRLLNTMQLGPGGNGFMTHVVYNLPGQANFFGVGMVLAILSVRLELGHALPARIRRFAEAPNDAWSLALFIFVLAGVIGSFATPLAPPGLGTLNFRTRFLANDALSTIFVFLLLMPTVFGVRRGDVAGRVLRWPPLVYFGVISYGVYLWHIPIGAWLLYHTSLVQTVYWQSDLGWVTRSVAVLALSAVVGTLSYRFVELPFLKLKTGRRRRRESQPALALGTPPAVP
jgi:peptidoglycan/LPS O-acetylase OafA/YrhL